MTAADDFLAQIATALVFGLAARSVGLPPLVGFLLAGFALKLVGFDSSPGMEGFADLGVTLLLFTIGLKLRIGDLARPHIWGSATLHMAITVLVFGGVMLFLPLGIFGKLDLPTALLIAFALSFSSTVFAVKIFDEQGRSESLHAETAIGILVVQDIVAVVFIAATAGAPPSPWALALLALIPGRHVLGWLANKAGHGELLLLLGVVLAIGAYELFSTIGLKGDLGALVCGMLLASHPKAKEMAGSLLSFKDLFLVGFFLSIGLKGIPTLTDIGVAGLLILVMPLKVVLFFLLLTRFRMRARTATMTSLALANYSEFGLIVAALGASLGWLSDQWLLIIAVAVAGTFIVASPANAVAHRIYEKLRPGLMRFEGDKRLPEQVPLAHGDAEVLIFGMGRLGTGAYDALREEYGDRLLGVDNNPRAVSDHIEAGRNVARGDPTDADFWARAALGGNTKMVLLALPNQAANLSAAREIIEHRAGTDIRLAATATYQDHIDQLLAEGVDAAFNFYAEAGQGYADFVRNVLEVKR